jgi:hypothetical protein
MRSEARSEPSTQTDGKGPSLTHQRLSRFPVELLAQELDHSLEAVRDRHPEEVLFHYRRVSDRFEAHDDCEQSKVRRRGWGWTGLVSRCWCRDGRMARNLWRGPSSCMTLKQRDPPRGWHQLQDLARSVGETSVGWRRVSVPCRTVCAVRDPSCRVSLYPGNCRQLCPDSTRAFDKADHHTCKKQDFVRRRQYP